MSIMMKAFTNQDDKEIQACVKMLLETDADTGFMHESLIKMIRRNLLASGLHGNTLFGELILKLVNEGKVDLLNEIK